MPALRCLLAVAVIVGCSRSAVTADQDAELIARHRALAAAQQRRSADVPTLLAAYQASLSAARATRPADPVVDWLSGDLLMSVGGEPDAVLPFFERAVRGGVREPDLFVSMARVQLELNQFDAALESAATAVDLAGSDETAWQLFAKVGFMTGRFDDVRARIVMSFGDQRPPWADEIARRADALAAGWSKEEQRRAADATARRTHVVFTIAPQALREGASDVTGTNASPGQVELELFDADAPATVRNFSNLVRRGFYDRSRFHWVKAAAFVIGGDPNTRNTDPNDDGSGGPGYVIADEFASPAARGHFRGVISMFEPQPGMAGSQFLICLVTCPEFDGRMTAFGRVVRGQDVLDRMKPGRTAIRPGDQELTIPGDVLVTARVVIR